MSLSAGVFDDCTIRSAIRFGSIFDVRFFPTYHDHIPSKTHDEQHYHTVSTRINADYRLVFPMSLGLIAVFQGSTKVSVRFE